MVVLEGIACRYREWTKRDAKRQLARDVEARESLAPISRRHPYRHLAIAAHVVLREEIGVDPRERRVGGRHRLDPVQQLGERAAVLRAERVVRPHRPHLAETD